MTCGHPGAGPTRICAHLLGAIADRRILRWTGAGIGVDLACPACRTADLAAFVDACAACRARVEEAAFVDGVEGKPAPISRASSLGWLEEILSLDVAPPSPVVAVAVPAVAGRRWITLAADGSIGMLDLPRREVRPLARVPDGTVGVGELSLFVSRDGRFAAVVNTYGQHGAVVDLESGAVTMPLDRGDYHVRESSFPIAFISHEGKTLVVHGTAWNRLEISDPATGTIRRERGSTAMRRGERQPDHYLDYFHGALVVSPDGRWIAEDGWAWHPVGLPVAWSLARWLDENPWESEDGPSRHNFLGRNFWDAPLCWLDETTLGIWGGSFDDIEAQPLLHRVDVTTHLSLEPFACPGGLMEREGNRLYVFGREHGLSVLDATTGERLLHRPDVVPTAHRGGGEFLTLLPGGAFKVGRITS